MGQHHSGNQSRLTILSGNAEVCTVGAIGVVIDIQNELLLKIRQLDRLTNLRFLQD
tara:strand:- start:473 stop:640 length:168 start_codon:yes stop_codon:yes gene_type:complete